MSGAASQERSERGYSDESFQRIADGLPHLVWTAKADGTIDFFNRRWIEYTGITLEKFAANGPRIGVVHPDEFEPTWALWRSCLESGQPYETEYRLRRLTDGAYRWFLARAEPIHDAKGKIVRWVGTATDIDAQRRATESMSFVVEVGNVLAASLELDEICASLARVAVEHFADWCHVVLLREGKLTSAAIYHKNPKLLEAVERYRNHFNRRPDDPLERAVKYGESLLLERIPSTLIDGQAQDSEHLELLRSLGMKSLMLVPLSAPDGKVYGTMSMVSSESGRAFNERDLVVAKAVAARAAVAIQNALLFADERRAAEQLRLSSRVNSLLFETGDPWKAMERVAQIVATEVGDACAILRLQGDTLRTEIVVHRDPATDAATAVLRGRRVMRLGAELELAQQLKQHRTIVLSDGDGEHMVERAWPYLSAEVKALDAKTSVIVPLDAGASTYGALVAHYSREEFDSRDIPLLEEIAARASVAIEHAETLERERRIATTLQQASLPSLIPKPKGLRFDTVYSPAGDEADVGGDWYDAIELDDGSVVVSVGDVTGRGIQAAAIMSKVRHAMGMAPLHESDPTKILDAAGWFLGKRYPEAIVTAFVAIVSPDRKTLRYATAGHPLPILRRDGELIELETFGLPLGLRHLAPPERSNTLELQDGDILLLYTDGLIEARRDIELGESALREVLRSELFAASASPARLVARACLPPAVHDDVAILAVLVGRPPVWSLYVDDARAAVDARSHFVDFLKGLQAGEDFIDRAELIFGELLGNVVRHAPGPVEISVESNVDSIVLHVIDSGRPLPESERRLPDDLLSERGRGLFIVAELASEVRVEHVRNCGNHLSVMMSL
jgi:PAS domain S-box-containing protein